MAAGMVMVLEGLEGCGVGCPGGCPNGCPAQPLSLRARRAAAYPNANLDGISFGPRTLLVGAALVGAYLVWKQYQETGSLLGLG